MMLSIMGSLYPDLWYCKMNFIPYISMDACAGNVTDVYKMGQDLLMRERLRNSPLLVGAAGAGRNC